jgi:triacylglycerol lipase
VPNAVSIVTAALRPEEAFAVPEAALVAALAVALVVVGLLAVRRFLRERLRRLRRRVCRTAPRYPVVLAHGIMGFDEVRVGTARHDYFRGVRSRLEQEGLAVHRPRVAKTASVAARAAELAAFIRDVPARKVNVVAHSMGGLDARYAISKLGVAGKVASLVTVGTPHLGTPLADACAAVGERVRLFDALARIGIDAGALRDLTTERMTAFNTAVPDARGVVYGSVVAVAPRLGEVNPLLAASWLWLGDRGGRSDGVVPAASQRWGQVLSEIEADHWAQIGWSRSFDAAAFYVELLRELRSRGL